MQHRLNLTVILLTLLMSACTSQAVKVKPHEGEILNGSVPQAIEQCQAQPSLDWCNVKVPKHAN